MFQVWFNELIFIMGWKSDTKMNHITWYIWTESYRDDMRERRNFYNWN